MLLLILRDLKFTLRSPNNGRDRACPVSGALKIQFGVFDFHSNKTYRLSNCVGY